MSPLRRMFAVVALALFFAPLIASAPLFDPDEGLHAAIAQEMVQRGDYVTPTFRGEPFLDKPILFFWAEAASLRFFGHNEAAVRIPPLLFGLFGMVTVALLGRALSGESAGLISGIVYGTMLLPMGVSEVAVHDIGLVPFLCTAALCIARVADVSDPVASAFPGPSAVGGMRRVAVNGVIAGVALGLSILTKGLVGIVFAGIFGACLVARRPGSLLRVAAVLTIAVLVAVAVAAPWYIAMEQAHPGYLHYYFVERHLQGYLTATQRHAGRPFWYYIPIVLGGTLPWTGYLAGALRSASRVPPASPGPWGRRALWGWFAVGLVFLSIGESKLVTYALPLFPALALIIGEYVSASLLGSGSARLEPPGRLFTLAFALQVLALALLPAIGLVLIQFKFTPVPPWLWAVVAVFGLLAIEAGRRGARAASASGRLAGVVGMTLCSLAAMMIVAPRAAAWMTGRDLAAALNAGGALPPRVWVIDERIGSLIFYLDPRLRADATPDRVGSASFAEAMTRLRTDPPDALIAVRNSQLPRFNRMFSSPPDADAAAGTFTLFRTGTLRAGLGAR